MPRVLCLIVYIKPEALGSCDSAGRPIKGKHESLAGKGRVCRTPSVLPATWLTLEVRRAVLRMVTKGADIVILEPAPRVSLLPLPLNRFRRGRITFAPTYSLGATHDSTTAGDGFWLFTPASWPITRLALEFRWAVLHVVAKGTYIVIFQPAPRITIFPYPIDGLTSCRITLVPTHSLDVIHDSTTIGGSRGRSRGACGRAGGRSGGRERDIRGSFPLVVFGSNRFKYSPIVDPIFPVIIYARCHDRGIRLMAGSDRCCYSHVLRVTVGCFVAAGARGRRVTGNRGGLDRRATNDLRTSVHSGEAGAGFIRGHTLCRTSLRIAWRVALGATTRAGRQLWAILETGWPGRRLRVTSTTRMDGDGDLIVASRTTEIDLAAGTGAGSWAALMEQCCYAAATAVTALAAASAALVALGP